MLICLSPSAILLKITLIIHKEKKKKKANKPSTGESWGLRRREEELSRPCRAIAGAARLNSALARQSHAPCLAQGPGSSAGPCQSPAQQEEASSGQQMLLTLTPVTNRKDKKSLEEAATCFLCRELGDGAVGGGGSRTAPLGIAAPSKLSLSACHCLAIIATEKENKIRAIINATQPFQINTLL